MDLDLVALLRTRPTIALVGATNDRTKFGNIILRDLLSKGFLVKPVNPRAKAVEDIPAFADLSAAAAAGDIGLVVYVVPPKFTLESLEEAKRLGLKRVWVQPGAGDEGVRQYLEQNQFEYLINACVMVEAS